MICVEGYKAFHGTMKITPKVAGAKPMMITADWLYNPEYGCWYGGGHSYAESICVPMEEETVK